MARKYQFRLDDTMKADESFIDAMDALFSNLNIDPAIAQALVDGYSHFASARIAQLEVASNAEIAALKQNLGDKFDATVAAGKEAVKQLGLDRATVDRLHHEHGLEGSMRLLAAVGQKLASSSPPAAPAAPPAAAKSPTAAPAAQKGQATTADAAAAEIKRLQGDSSFVSKLFNPRAVGHAEAAERWNSLHETAFAPPAQQQVADHKKLYWDGLPQETKDAVRDREGGPTYVARGRIEDLLSQPSFMDSIRDTSHPDHAANRATLSDLQRQAGDRP